MPWLRPDELRIGLGCMRLDPDDSATVEAALAAGITVFDTARAYERSEELLARVLRNATGVRIVTKGGMSRPNSAWVPDGRAKTIRADCEASLAALDGLEVDLFLLHTPDPRTPWSTSVRALARLVDDGLVERVGICNVSRAQLDQALDLAPIAAVQVGLSVLDDRALRGGVVERCAELRVALVAHSPLGGPRRVSRLSRHVDLLEIARARGATEAEVALAWVLGLGEHVVAIPGARTPGAVRSAARASSLELTRDESARIAPSRPRARRATTHGDVVLVMGVPGAGKSRVAAGYVDRGYARLNRDERGGSLRELAGALDAALADGAREIVLDNTYLTRASRSYVVEAAASHGVAARCIWVDTPLAHAQVNLVERLLERFDALPTPEELKEASQSVAGALTPTQQMRAFRELEAPAEDEGFSSVDHVAFAREPRAGTAGVLVAAAAVGALPLADVDPGVPHLVFDWRPDGAEADLAEPVAAAAGVVSGPLEAAICPHPGGPPICWCRPPLPGLALAFARRHGVDPAQSVVVGESAAHRTLANALGARYVAAS
ncbi:MAG TPA: aldo/keto reductase [Gaiellaceae bacterium]|nr:aldo/keto reductase [Gaiellaceae bacterium]